MFPLLPSPLFTGSEKASLISSGDHFRLETKRITVLTLSLSLGRLNSFFPHQILTRGLRACFSRLLHDPAG
jgi:hypothetical protein